MQVSLLCKQFLFQSCRKCDDEQCDYKLNCQCNCHDYDRIKLNHEKLKSVSIIKPIVRFFLFPQLSHKNEKQDKIESNTNKIANKVEPEKVNQEKVEQVKEVIPKDNVDVKNDKENLIQNQNNKVEQQIDNDKVEENVIQNNNNNNYESNVSSYNLIANDSQIGNTSLAHEQKLNKENVNDSQINEINLNNSYVIGEPNKTLNDTLILDNLEDIDRQPSVTSPRFKDDTSSIIKHENFETPIQRQLSGLFYRSRSSVNSVNYNSNLSGLNDSSLILDQSQDTSQNFDIEKLNTRRRSKYSQLIHRMANPENDEMKVLLKDHTEELLGDAIRERENSLISYSKYI